MSRKHASAMRGWLHQPTHALGRGAVALVSVALIGVVAVTTAWTSARTAAAPVHLHSTAPTARHHYRLYPGDVVGVNGFSWSCSFYWVAGVGSYRAFECRGGTGGPTPPASKRHLRLRVVVVADGLLVKRGHKTVYFAYR